MSETQIAILPRAIIPDLVLTPSPVLAPSRDDFLVADIKRRFNARRVDSLPVEVAYSELYRGEVEVCEPEWAKFRVEPEWGKFGFRGQVGRLLWACGLRKKAIRFLSCNKCARPGVCSRYPYEHKYFIPNGCEVIFCRECSDESRRELLLDYWHVVCNAVLDFAGAGERAEHERLSKLLFDSELSVRDRDAVELELGKLWLRVGASVKKSGFVLARVTFTLRSDGSEITPERVKKFNACVRRVMQKTVGSRMGYGLLFDDEVGFELRGHLPDALRLTHGLNLHAHGLYFGPYLDWRRTRDLWATETEKRFGQASLGFYVTAVKRFAANPGWAIRWALNHMLKYLSKPPAVSPERLASLIAAFHGTKRVHSLGLFDGKKPEREKKNCLCPGCKASGVVSSIDFEGRALPNGGCIPRLELIENLLAQGYVSLREAGRSAVLAMGGDSS